MFKISTKREFTVKGEIAEGFEVSVTFTRLAKEETGKMFAETVGDKGELDNGDMMNLFFKERRKSLVACEGFADEDGNEMSIKDEEGNINEQVQIAVFEAVANSPLWQKVVDAFDNVSTKNLKTGASQS